MKKQTATDDLIALICKAATEKFSEDDTRPGVQIAHIPYDTAESSPAFWYVALHRYPKVVYPLARDADGRAIPPASRSVVFSSTHAVLDRAVQLLALQFLPIEAQAELAEALKGVDP